MTQGNRKHATSKSTINAYQFFKQFPTEQAAIAYIERRRWKSGIVCAHCQSPRTARQRQTMYHQCNDCRRKFTVRTGTIFERSHIPLDKWLYAIYLLQTARKGTSSLQLSKEIGVTQKSTWFMLHRLREACGLDAESLRGTVEIDETYIGGLERNRHAARRKNAGRGTAGKQGVMGMRERGGKTIARTIDNTDAGTLTGLIHRHVAPGSVVFTDDHRSYRGLGKTYAHTSVKHSAKEYVNGMAHTNGIESVWAVLKRGYNGVYHNWSLKHMARYINEFSFRLNAGHVKQHTLTRIDGVLDGAIGKRLTFAGLTHG